MSGFEFNKEETKEELIENWSEWLLRRLNTNLGKRYNKGYIKLALLECSKDYVRKSNKE